jgi:hypothetical protein
MNPNLQRRRESQQRTPPSEISDRRLGFGIVDAWKGAHLLTAGFIRRWSRSATEGSTRKCDCPLSGCGYALTG